MLLMLSLAVIHYGWLFLRAQQITNVARHGARLAIRYDPGVDVANVVTSMLGDNGITGATVNVTDGYASAPVGTYITVKISVAATTANGVVLFGGMNGPLIILPTPGSVGASVTMAKEGPGSGS